MRFCILDMGPEVVLVTSLQHAATPPDRIEMLTVTCQGAWILDTPMLPMAPPERGRRRRERAVPGASLHGDSPEQALDKTAGAIFKVFEITHAAGARALQLVAAMPWFGRLEAMEVRRVGRG